MAEKWRLDVPGISDRILIAVAKAAAATKVQRFYMTAPIPRRFFIALATLLVCMLGNRALHGAQAFAIVDSQTGFVLDEQDPRAKRQIGSLTKVATAMVVLDWAEKRSGDLNQVVVIP